MRVQRYSKALKRYSPDLGTCKNLYRDGETSDSSRSWELYLNHCSHPSGHARHKQCLSDKPFERLQPLQVCVANLDISSYIRLIYTCGLLPLRGPYLGMF